MDKSLESLEGELEQLLDLFRDFNELVHAQQPMVDQCMVDSLLVACS